MDFSKLNLTDIKKTPEFKDLPSRIDDVSKWRLNKEKLIDALEKYSLEERYEEERDDIFIKTTIQDSLSKINNMEDQDWNFVLKNYDIFTDVIKEDYYLRNMDFWDNISDNEFFILSVSDDFLEEYKEYLNWDFVFGTLLTDDYGGVTTIAKFAEKINWVDVISTYALTPEYLGGVISAMSFITRKVTKNEKDEALNIDPRAIL